MSNRLARETSPYLQQHADNPVEWYPWGEEALALARTEDKPILLSIGYSACHWCHVMAHESFEDPEVAAEMNRHFVNIKVDREERPDLDQIYQTAHQMLTQRGGGWPLTAFLTPGGAPFFVGTYFPKSARFGMPGFKDLLPKIAAAYREKRAEIASQNDALLDGLKRTAPTLSPTEPNRGPIDAAVAELAQVFDDVHGGIGSAPKFPHPFELHFCLSHHVRDAEELAGAIARVTLTKMAEGGIFDQLGGGFCRYSVDRYWSIPHFEKMLHDNGPLLALYTDAWRVARDPLYESTVRETAAWVMREMQSPVNADEGGYYSSLDADSEHVEGKFYVWTRDDVRALLSPEEYAVVGPYYGLDGPPNFEEHYWHLRIAQSLDTVARSLGISSEDCALRCANARAKLFAARERRIRPGRDEKVLTSWNALMAKGMARAACVFDEEEWLTSATRAIDFIHATLWRDGRLLATYKDGRAHLNAYLDDYAFMLDTLLELLQTRFRRVDLELARALAECLLDHFEDRQNGGFYFVSHDHEQLIHRPKSGHDGATPSGNGVAAFALQRLGHIIGEPRYLEAAERTVRLFYPQIERNPSSHASLLAALEEMLEPPAVVILRGDAAGVKAWQSTLAQTLRPDAMVISVPTNEKNLPATLDKALPRGAARAAWVCRALTCLPPETDIAAVARLLDS